MAALARLFRYLRNYRGQTVWSLVLMLIAAGMSLVQPLMTQRAIDLGVTPGQVGPVVFWSLILIGAAVVSGGLHLLGGVLLSHAGQGMAYEIRNDLFRRIMSFSYSNLDRWRTGELLVRTNSDVNTVRMFVRMGLFLMLQSVIMLTGSLIIMYQVNARLSIVMFIVLPGTLALFFVLAVIIRPLFSVVRDKLDAVNNVIQENLSGAKVVRAFARQAYEEERFATRNDQFLRISLRVGYIVALAFPFLFLLGRMAVVLVTWVGGTAVIENLVAGTTDGLTLGQLLAFNEYALLAVFPILALGFTLSMLSRAAASATRVADLLAEEPDLTEAATPVSADRLSGAIAFEDVSFAYGDAENAIEGITLSIAPGEKIGILGRTGSGKSSLAALIPRMYDVGSGRITIDGVDVRDYSLQTLRRRVTLVLQETVLLSGSILDNVTYAPSAYAHAARPRPGAEQAHDAPPPQPDERAIEAARIACALDFIGEKDAGWNEHVGERGTGLSGGQRQRVAIARAILADPDVLILDDVTSAVDASTEKKIVSNLYRHLKEKTVVIISQKINTIMLADRIFVLEEGRIAGIGTHEELLATSDTYREIFDTQSAEIRV